MELLFIRVNFPEEIVSIPTLFPGGEDSRVRSRYP